MVHDARERILSACERVIASAGLRGFRMQEVARQADVSIGLLAYHFGDRDGLMQAALDHVTAAAVDRARGVPEHAPAADRLAALLCSEFGDSEAIRSGSIAWNEVRAAAVFEAAPAGAVSRSTESWQRTVEALVREAVREAADRGPVGDPAGLALILTSLVEGLSGRWLTGQLSAGEAQAAVRAALEGLGFRLS
ncbi:TetR/AcrR family transcriptional regulator [Leucobacter sp. USHLN153]|uniref:TetR/AcrR family transcriptional regulator n=1 Tax=Leucobacter sp. USHLN153 TaxID=3081268 RepID=UPI0030159949